MFERKTVLLALLLVAAAACAAACGRSAKDEASGTPLQEAARYYRSKCFTCHGTNGRGDGPMSASLNPKPRDHTDPVWQDSVDDAFIRKVILEGGRATGLSPSMPANPELKNRPELLDALVKFIRNFRRPNEA